MTQTLQIITQPTILETKPATTAPSTIPNATNLAFNELPSAIMPKYQLRKCDKCGYEAKMSSNIHRIRIDGVRVKCGSMRVVRD